MDAKRLLVGTVVGGIVIMGLGFVVFGLLLQDFMAGYMSETGASAMRNPELIWPIAVGNLAWAALICVALGNRSGAGAGAATGAIVGLLLWVTADFLLYGLLDLWKPAMLVLDPLASGALSTIAGAVIGFVLSKMKSA
jgi:hypothetical protein